MFEHCCLHTTQPKKETFRPPYTLWSFHLITLGLSCQSKKLYHRHTMVLVTLAWMTHSPGCHNCLVVTTWYATIFTDGETDKLLLLRNILMQIGSWWVGRDYLDENGCSGTIRVRKSGSVHVPGPIGSNRFGYGSRISDLIGPTVDESG